MKKIEGEGVGLYWLKIQAIAHRFLLYTGSENLFQNHREPDKQDVNKS
jgi:hypothetical protein